MLWEGIYVAACIIATFGALLFDKIPPDMAMMGCLSMVMAPKIVSVKEALAGFSNSAVISVAGT